MASARNKYGGTGTPTGAGALSAARAITQSAAGVPTHSAPKNTLYLNESTGILYYNTNGSTGWATTGGGGGSGTQGLQGRPGDDGRDGEDGERGPPGRDGGTGAAGADGRMGPPGWDAEPEDFGLWVPPAVPVSPRFRAPSGLLLPAGALYDTFPRTTTIASNGQAVIASGRVQVWAIDLPIDLIVTSITFVSGTTALNIGTHQYFALHNSALAQLGVSADDTSTPWAASTAKTLALTTPFRTTYSGLHYLAILVTATTVPTLMSNTAQATVMAIAPSLSFNGNAGQISIPNPITAGSNVSNMAYAYVS